MFKLLFVPLCFLALGTTNNYKEITTAYNGFVAKGIIAQNDHKISFPEIEVNIGIVRVAWSIVSSASDKPYLYRSPSHWDVAFALNFSSFSALYACPY